jgi:CheY-like chemotaxis protein
MRNIMLELCMEKLQTEFAAIYCFDEKKYFLLKFKHKTIENAELVCSSFDFEEDKILTVIEIEKYFTSHNFTINNMIVIPINKSDEKLGMIMTGNLEITRKEKRKSFTDVENAPWYNDEKINSLKPYLLSFLHGEKYRFLYENKLSLGSTDFSKDLLLVNMSHEIRTPLNGIIGYNQLLSKTQLNEIQQTYLISMNYCCYQLMQIVNDVLDYAKLSTNKVLPNLECFNLKDLEISVINIMRTQLNSKKQKLIFKIEEGIPEFVYADKPKIIQILLNLISNAYKFSPENSEIKVYIKESKENMILFEIVDQGCGMSEEEQNKLFHVFTQLKNNNIKIGTGLGLAISKKLVEILEGDIWVNSKINKGTTLNFTIKYQNCEDIENKIITYSHLLKDKYVLVVDDNSNNRMILCDILFEWGATPILCASGIEAITIIIKNRYNFCLALIDICMAEINGIELAKLIKNENKNLPLIALNSSSEFSNEELFDYRVEKPIHKLKLFNCILKVLKKDNLNEICLSRDSSFKENFPENKSELNILIAEDINYSLTLMVNMLKSLEYNRVDTAYDGVNAIHKLDKASKREKPYDIIFLDIKMPRKDGYDVISHIKRKKYKICIIIISASVLEEEKLRCLKYGIKYFLSKPVQIKQLNSILQNI